METLPRFTDPPKKNDALFLYAGTRPLPFVFCYEQQAVEVVHGPSCKPEAEIDLERCAADGVAVAARRGGGGTVVLSPGVVVTVVAGRRRGDEMARPVFSRIHAAMTRLLQPFCGGSITGEGISDLAVDGRKFCGSSLYLGRNPPLYYYQSSIMASSDTALIGRYLKHPPREPAYRRGRPHAEFCTTLRQAGCRLTPAQIAAMFTETLKIRLEEEEAAAVG